MKIRRVLICIFALLWIAAPALASMSVPFCVVPPTGKAAFSPKAHELRDSLQAKMLKRMRQESPKLKVQQALEIKPALGVIRALVLLADFPDTIAKTSVSAVNEKLFSVKTFPTGSFRDYYLENSYGKLDIQGDVVGDPKSRTGWLRMKRDYGYYANNQFGLGEPPRSAKQLVIDAIEAAFKANPNLDPTKYDRDRDGKVDMLIVVHAGGGSEGTTDPSQIWSHHSEINPPIIKNGVAFTNYAIVAEDSNIGIYVHEVGHILGLPDLYGTANSSAGLGFWSLMAAGSNLPNDAKQPTLIGTRPSHLDAWCKMRLGWLEPTEITTNSPNIKLPAVETTPQVIKVPANPMNPLEYWLIETRWADPSNFDQYLPGSGVLIYHVDETRMGNDDRGHPLIAIEEADGNFNLYFPIGHPLSNFGDSTDPFSSKSPKKVFGPRTTPGSINYSGKDSYLVVENFTDPGPEMGFDIRFDYGQGSISGTISTADGKPLPAFTLQLMQGDKVLDNKPTITDNSYVFPSLLEGAYSVSISAEGYIPISRLVPYLGGKNVKVDLVLLPQPDLKPGWNLVGFPMDFGESKASEVFSGGEEAGATVFWYDPSANQYVQNPPMKGGQGYWIYVKDPEKYKITRVGQVADPQAPFAVPIKPGWNLIANPYLVSLPWDLTRFSINSGGETRRFDAAAFTGWVRNFCWIYSPDKGYVKVSPPSPGQTAQSIPAWAAFWLRSNVEGTLLLSLSVQ